MQEFISAWVIPTLMSCCYACGNRRRSMVNVSLVPTPFGEIRRGFFSWRVSTVLGSPAAFEVLQSTTDPFGPVTATTTRSKSTTAARIVELEQQNQRLAAQLSMLTAQAAPAEEGERPNELRQRLWLNDRYSFSTTRNTGNKSIRFSAQKSVRKQDGSRAYGEYRNFVAYGEDADVVQEIFSQEDRLVDIEAFESPYQDGSKRSEWVIVKIALVPREEPAAPVQHALPFAQEPSGEKVPF